MLITVKAVLSYVWFNLRTFSWKAFLNNAEVHYEAGRLSEAAAAMAPKGESPMPSVMKMLEASAGKLEKAGFDPTVYDDPGVDTFPMDDIKLTSHDPVSFKKKTSAKKTVKKVAPKKTTNVHNRKTR